MPRGSRREVRRLLQYWNGLQVADAQRILNVATKLADETSQEGILEPEPEDVSFATIYVSRGGIVSRRADGNHDFQLTPRSFPTAVRFMVEKFRDDRDAFDRFYSSRFPDQPRHCDNVPCIGGRAWQTDASVRIDRTRLFCCAECADEWARNHQPHPAPSGFVPFSGTGHRLE